MVGATKDLIGPTERDRNKARAEVDPPPMSAGRED